MKLGPSLLAVVVTRDRMRSGRRQAGRNLNSGSTPHARPWLTTDRQERFADTVSTLSKEQGWAAGCVFRYNVNEEVVAKITRPPGTAAYSVVNDPELRPALVVYVEGDRQLRRVRSEQPDLLLRAGVAHECALCSRGAAWPGTTDGVTRRGPELPREWRCSVPTVAAFCLEPSRGVLSTRSDCNVKALLLP